MKIIVILLISTMLITGCQNPFSNEVQYKTFSGQLKELTKSGRLVNDTYLLPYWIFKFNSRVTNAIISVYVQNMDGDWVPAVWAPVENEIWIYKANNFDEECRYKINIMKG